MISGDRVCERAPFLAGAPIRSVGRLRYLYATFRQGLLDYITQRSPGTVLMPDYVPQGVHDPYLRAGWRIVFYPTDITMALDGPALSRLIAAEKPDHIVYIHYFGIYIEENIRILRGIVPAEVLLLEDFAHTLPQDDVPVTGRLAAYSFTKMLGVPEGALLWFRDKADLVPCRTTEDDQRAQTLRGCLTRRCALESFFATVTVPRRAESAIRRLLRGPTEYYDFLQEHYPAIRAPIGRRSREILERVDLARIAARRREIARLYVEGLDQRLRLPQPDEALTRQALYAFPVQVEDRGAFHRHLRARGVRGTALVDHWWFKEERPVHALRDRHYLLPVNHYLGDGKIRRVISAANAYVAGR